MPPNSPEYMREYHKKHYAANRQKYIDQSSAYKKKLRDAVWALKEKPCMDCGNSYPPWVMQFDHRGEQEKDRAIGILVAMGARNKVFEEIKKCDLVCANCHAIRTHDRLENAPVVSTAA